MPNILDRITGLSARGRLLVMVLLGVIAGLGQAPFDFWPATLFALAGLFLLHGRADRPRSAAFQGWAFGFGYFGFSLRWIVEPFMVDVAHDGWMAPFAIVFLAGGLALFWAAAGYLAARAVPRCMVGLAVLLLWAEVVRSLALTGFPWALLGHVWVSTWVAQAASFGGPHFLTGVTVLLAWALAALAGRRLIGLGVLAATICMAVVLKPVAAVGPDTKAPIVRLVQPNAPQHQKWDPAYRDMFLQRMLSFSSRGPLPDLIVWPETSVPSFLNYIEGDMSVLSDAARGVPMVFGIQRLDAQNRYYNSLVVMGAGGTINAVYDKSHLVPFGEYIPGGALLEQFGLHGLAANIGSGFVAGQGGGTVSIPAIGSAVPLICYEGIFAEEIYRGPDRPRLMLLITNDAWFGDAAGPYQHLAQARLRAIEQGLPMVRVANTGVSAMIDAHGRIIDQIALGVDGTIDVALPPALPQTIYSRWGDWPFGAFILLFAFGFFGLSRRYSD